MFLNVMQCIVSQLVNGFKNVLYYFDLKLEPVLFPADRVLKVVEYMVV